LSSLSLYSEKVLLVLSGRSDVSAETGKVVPVLHSDESVLGGCDEDATRL